MDKTPFTIAAERAENDGAQELGKRIRTEGKIARFAASALLGAGYSVGVNDGVETVVERSRSINDVLQAMFSTDEDYLFAYTDEGRIAGTIYFVYGNDGPDVINDYSESLEPVMVGVNAYADGLGDQA